MFQIDYRSGVSICEQIVNNIIRLKTLGVFKSDTKLPSVRGLASKLSVNPNTVLKAYSILEANGIICSVKGKGTFICDDEGADVAIKENAKAEFLSAVKSAFDLGLDADELIKIIKQQKEKTDDNG